MSEKPSQKTVWIFGLYERPDEIEKQAQKKGRVLFFVVPKRDAVNLLNIIYEFVKPGTTIISDCWKAYSRIDKLGKEYRQSKWAVNQKYHVLSVANYMLSAKASELICQGCIKMNLKEMQ